MIKKAKLILKDGSEFEGISFGANKNNSGEVVFTTGMVGYPESITDPSYAGQILTFTYPMVGNYGIPDFKETDEDEVSKHFEREKIALSGVIISDYSANYNHWNASGSLGKWLEENNIPAIANIDTRALTQKLREKGSTLGKILIEGLEDEFKNIPDPNKVNLVDLVSCKNIKYIAKGKKHVVVVDCGMKNNIIRSFLQRNISITIVPWNHNFWNDASIKKFDGVFISNGPGDPITVTETQNLVKKCFEEKMPVFGICLGTQIMALAAGAKTYKLKFGHRSHNQPCMDLETGRCYITSQNHGYAIDSKTLPKDWKVWFENVNDKTVEGIKHSKLPFFSVQFHPESTPGPNDTNWLFDEFVKAL